MSERIEPRLEHRIVDGEMLSTEIDEKIQRGKDFSEQKEILKETDEEKFAESFAQDALLEDPDSILKDYKVNPQVSISQGAEEPSFMEKFGSVMAVSLLSVSVAIGIAVYIFVAPDMISKDSGVNEFQSQITQLTKQNQTLTQQIETMEGVNKDTIEAEINRVIGGIDFSKGDGSEGIEIIKNNFDQKLNSVEEKLSSSSAELAEIIATTKKDLEQQIQRASETAKLEQPKNQEVNEEIMDRLSELEKSVENKLEASAAEVKANSTKVEELIQRQAGQGTVGTGGVLQLGIGTPLESFQIQQWIVEINTQWILYGRIQDTQQQLLALEQAVSLSDFAYTTQLARLIGQDLGYLKQLKDGSVSNKVPSTEALQKAVAELSYERISSKVNEPGADESLSALDKLMESFSQLVSVKKREADEEMTEVNAILQNDVLKQRLALMVDRLDWGLTVESKDLVKQSSAGLQKFVDANYPSASGQFKELLDNFEDVEFTTNKPLSILKLDEAM